MCRGVATGSKHPEQAFGVKIMYTSENDRENRPGAKIAGRKGRGYKNHYIFRQNCPAVKICYRLQTGSTVVCR
jgi:hypothetical protein